MPKAAVPTGPTSGRSAQTNALIIMRQSAMHFSEGDVDQDGTMDFKEFVGTIPPSVREQTPVATLREWFAMIDTDGSGAVTRDEHMRWSLSVATIASGTGIEKAFRRYDREFVAPAHEPRGIQQVAESSAGGSHRACAAALAT
jgi:hypothetical protein